MSSLSTAAFFDLDNTLMKGASLFVMARHALRSRLYTRRALLRDACTQVSFRLSGMSDESLARVRDRALRGIAGTRQADLEGLTEAVVADIEARVFPAARERVEWHHAQGHRTYVVSASSIEIVEPVAVALGMDGAIATRGEIDDTGCYTGRILGPWVYGPGKADAVRALAAEQGVDLAASWAYSDSASDAPMLELVGHPVVVNPDRALRRLAVERGWDTLRYERLRRRLAVGGGSVLLAGAGAAATRIAWGIRHRRRAAAAAAARSLRGRLRLSTAGT